MIHIIFTAGQKCYLIYNVSTAPGTREPFPQGEGAYRDP